MLPSKKLLTAIWAPKFSVFCRMGASFCLPFLVILKATTSPYYNNHHFLLLPSLLPTNEYGLRWQLYSTQHVSSILNFQILWSINAFFLHDSPSTVTLLSLLITANITATQICHCYNKRKPSSLISCNKKWRSIAFENIQLQP